MIDELVCQPDSRDVASLVDGASGGPSPAIVNGPIDAALLPGFDGGRFVRSIGAARH